MRGTASLFVPAVVLVVIAAGVFLKPWQHIGVGSGPTLPTPVASGTPHVPAPVRHGPSKMTALELEALLQGSATTLHWSCAKDAAGKWDYLCSLRETRAVWGFDVDSTRITSRDELSWEGHPLSP